MNVQCFAIFLLGFAAYLTAIAVAFARSALLLMPVWAIVANRSAFPGRTVFANKMFFVPFSPMLRTTEMPSPLDRAYLPGFAPDRFTAKSAVRLNSWRREVRIILIAHMNRAPFVPATLTAEKILVTFNFRRVANDFFSTLGAIYRDVRALVGVSVGAGLGLQPRAVAFRAAEVTLLSLRVITLTHKNFAAPVASNLLVRAVLLAFLIAVVTLVTVYRTHLSQNLLPASVTFYGRFWFPVRVVFSQLRGLLVGDMAIAVAIVFFVEFQYGRHFFDGLTAIRALNNNPVSAHKITSYRLTDALAEGAPIAVGGQRIITGCKHPVNDGCALSK